MHDMGDLKPAGTLPKSGKFEASTNGPHPCPLCGELVCDHTDAEKQLAVYDALQQASGLY